MTFLRFAPILMMLAGCVGAEPSDSIEQALQPRACPAIAILCIDGYRAKQLPNCNQVCVPDHQQHDCNSDADCPQIYCITTPCPQYICRGHQCVFGSDTGGGQPCGNAVCGANSYCCDPNCGTCAPDGYACILGCAAY